MKENELLAKRFLELAERSYNTSSFKFTDFLGLLEQNIFQSVKKELYGIKYECFGGVAGAERIIIRFGDEEELGYSEPFPISCIKISPKCERFADRLTHRDFLGAILNLGLERDKLGDIVIVDNVAYLFAKDEIADFLVESLERVRHTDVVLRIVDAPPASELYRTERRKIQISSERLDAIISKLFRISREASSLLFTRGAVFINGRICQSQSERVKEGEIISVRGYGKFIYRGVESESRKGKLNCTADVYV